MVMTAEAEEVLKTAERTPLMGVIHHDVTLRLRHNKNCAWGHVLSLASCSALICTQRQWSCSLQRSFSLAFSLVLSRVRDLHWLTHYALALESCSLSIQRSFSLALSLVSRARDLHTTTLIFVNFQVRLQRARCLHLERDSVYRNCL